MAGYDEAVAYWRGMGISTEAQLAAALSAHKTAFAYNSGKLENDKITYSDVREMFGRGSVSAYAGDLRTLREIRNAGDAYEYFLSAFGKKLPLDESFLKELQRRLTQDAYDAKRMELGERPGEYKKHDYAVGRDEVGAAPEDVAEEVSELPDELTGIEDRDALTAAAYFHAKLENIHPFADGNGRTGRLAMNYFLVVHGHPFVIIHAEDSEMYYSALEAWDTEQRLEPMRSFLKRQTVKTWEPQLRGSACGAPERGATP